MKYLKNPFLTKVSKTDTAKIERLMELTFLLGNRPLRNVKFINQVATALRFYFIFQALLNKNEEEIEKRVLYLYGEGASILGYVSAYRDISIKHFFLAKYGNSAHYFNEARYCVQKSYDLANLIGDISGRKRAKKLVYMFKFSSLGKFI